MLHPFLLLSASEGILGAAYLGGLGKSQTGCNWQMQVEQRQKLLLGGILDSARSKPASAIGSQGNLASTAAAIAAGLAQPYKDVMAKHLQASQLQITEPVDALHFEMPAEAPYNAAGG